MLCLSALSQNGTLSPEEMQDAMRVQPALPLLQRGMTCALQTLELDEFKDVWEDLDMTPATFYKFLE